MIWMKRLKIDDARCTEAYTTWWETHGPVRLNKSRFLEEDDIAPSIDEIVECEEDRVGEEFNDRCLGGEGGDKEKQQLWQCRCKHR